MSAFTLANFEPVKLSINTEAELAKSQALDGARAIVAITDAESQQAAVDALARCKRFTNRLEDSRTDVKAPVLKLGKEIDAMAKSFAAEVDSEASRLSKLINDHVRAEAEKAARAQKIRDDMAAKKRQREEEEARRADEERKRLEKESAKAEDPEEAAKLAREAQNAAFDAEQARQRADSVSTAVVAAPAKASGMAVKKVWKHRITDIHALYKARPDLVALEPKTNQINAVIRQGGERAIPGLEIFEEIDTTVRS
ncbi:MAG: hypothetical protein WCK57_07605 [Verrucomicrobiae bacterium]